MSFLELNSLFRGLICSWSIVLIVGYIVAFIRLNVKKIIYKIIAFIGFVCSYFIFQVCAEISDFKLCGKINPVANYLAGLHYNIYIIGLVLLTLVCILLNITCIFYKRKNITATTLKTATDSLPIGLCFYHESGYPYMVNYKMNEISYMISGHFIMNGNNFWKEIKKEDSIELADGRMYRFTKNNFELENEIIYEVIAEDITEICRKSKQLEDENERLRINIDRMRNQSDIIGETIHREEILNSKEQIHAEMNRLLLATNNAIESSTVDERNNIIKTWHKNILLLCLEVNNDDSRNPIQDLEELANLIGIRLVYNKIPCVDNYKVIRLFLLAAKEAMTNAVKHADAKTFRIKIDENDEKLEALFTNDGKVPDWEIRETGGLRVLRKKIEDEGGTMEIKVEKQYEFNISIPKGRVNYGI